MKKKFLTLGLFVAMMLGATGVKSSGIFCVGFFAPCGASTIACGTNLVEFAENAALMAEYVCSMDEYQ